MMSLSDSVARLVRPLSRVGSCCLLVAIVGTSQLGHAQTDNARQIVKDMADYLANQKVILATYDTDIEIVTTDLEKIQFTSSGELLLSRPNMFRASRVGGYSNVELVFDGTTAT